MKIIQVAGTSGTGKTRFIRELLPALLALGPTGVVKHIGHHTAVLETGKDTTLFFEGGAALSAGIDKEKTVIISRENGLPRVLAFLSDSGMRFAVVEGFKGKSFPKIVFGSLPGAERVLMIEPSVSEVVSRLHEFPDFFTAGGFSRELRSACGPGENSLVCTLAPVKKIPDEKITAGLRKVRSLVPGVSEIRLCTGEENETYIGVCAESLSAAVEAARLAAALLEEVDPCRAQN
jgi:molybdopterin-guanine dinucleotide biosynthesis protein MobB